MEIREATAPLSAESNGLPPALLSAIQTPPLERKSWLKTIAPNYIGLFLWVAYFDQLSRRTLPIGGLGWSAMGAAAASLLCYLFLYYVPAMWGQRTGRPLNVLGASTFGAKGSIWFTGALVGVSQVLWLAVSTFYATDWILQGLVSCGLLSPRVDKPIVFGGVGFQSPLFLITSLVWVFAASLTGRYLVRIIAALMNVYPVFPAVMLGVATVLMLKGVAGFQPLPIDPVTSEPIRNGGPKAFLLMIQLIFGFFAYAGAASADWGAVNHSTRDVRLGGLVGVAFASWVVATLALLIVAGAFGQYPTPQGMANAPGVANFSVRVALLLGVGGQLAGATLLIFGLASLAPTCYAAFIMGNQLSAIWPRLSRVRWTLLGALAAWPLIATGLANRLEAIFSILGALFAPVVGAMAADYFRSRGNWSGPRRGVNLAGVIAWVVGAVVGLVPLVAAWLGRTDWTWFQPAAVFAFLAAFLVDSILAALRLEPPVVPIPEAALPSESV